MAMVLRSPFNGQDWTVPADFSSELVAELLKRGFERVASTPNERDSNGSSATTRRTRTSKPTGADSHTRAAAFDARAEPGTQPDAADAVED